MNTRSLLIVTTLLVFAACDDGNSRAKDSGTDVDTDTDADTDTDTDTDSDTDTDTDTDADSDSDTGCTSDTECEALGLICNESWEICVVASCLGEDDFTPCEEITDPDRSYDICIEGECRSPGCGTADCNAPGPHFPPSDTNQRECCDGDGTITCPTSGDDLFGQDAQYGWDALNDPSSRFTRDLSVDLEPVVLDNVTELMWQGCTSGQNGASCEFASEDNLDWPAALSYCDSLDWGGYDDWRLPDEYELLSIVDFGIGPGLPLIDETVFPETPGDYFWTSSTSVSAAENAWEVYFHSGSLLASAKTYTDNVRCVRLGPNPRPGRFTRDLSVPGEPSVSDNETGLEWQGCPAGVSGDTCEPGIAFPDYSWLDALAYCEGLSWAGHDDWRLPNVKELESIIDNHAASPAIDGDAFPSTPHIDYWSSTPIHGGTLAYCVNFTGGRLSWPPMDYSYGYNVRCVRDEL